MRLTYSAYANILYGFIESTTTKKNELPKLLLSAACPDHTKAFKSICNIDETAGSRLFNGTRDIPTEIKQHYVHPDAMEPNMPELVEQHFEQTFSRLIDDERVGPLLKTFLIAIRRDENISKKQRIAFRALAKPDTLYKFF